MCGVELLLLRYTIGSCKKRQKKTETETEITTWQVSSEAQNHNTRTAISIPWSSISRYCSFLFYLHHDIFIVSSMYSHSILQFNWFYNSIDPSR